jgi:hypothetical protein
MLLLLLLLLRVLHMFCHVCSQVNDPVVLEVVLLQRPAGLLQADLLAAPRSSTAAPQSSGGLVSSSGVR